MKATVALAMANAIFAAATPLAKRALVTHVDVTTVTQYVYPDGSPATHLGGAAPAPTDAVITTATVPTPEEPAETEAARKPEPTSNIAGPAGNAQQNSPSTEKPEKQEPEKEEPKDDGGSYTAPGPGTSVQSACVDAHNAHRANHSVSAVKWDSALAASAQKLADSCDYHHDTKIGGGGYGQNIAMGAESDFDLSAGEAASRAITRQWYNNEFDLYPSYGSEPSMSNFEGWGHLSQMVWESTTEIGCAIALCGKGKLAGGMEGYFAVCNYSPPGNVKGAFSENVHAALGKAIIHV